VGALLVGALLVGELLGGAEEDASWQGNSRQSPANQPLSVGASPQVQPAMFSHQQGSPRGSIRSQLVPFQTQRQLPVHGTQLLLGGALELSGALLGGATLLDSSPLLGGAALLGGPLLGGAQLDDSQTSSQTIVPSMGSIHAPAGRWRRACG